MGRGIGCVFHAPKGIKTRILFTTEVLEMLEQAPEELAPRTSNDDCAANGDGKDICNNEVCGYCEIRTTRDDAERPLCVDQGNGIAVWGCEDSSCASGTTCGSPSCIGWY